MNRPSLSYILPGCLLVSALIALTGCSEVESEYFWPGDEWPISTPAEQGMNSGPIDSLVAEIEEGIFGQVDAMMIIRNGYVVANERFEQDYDALSANYDTTNHQYNYYHPDWHPYLNGSDLHSLQSVTKSVMSAALGIAIDKGYIESASQFVYPFFKSFEPYPEDARRDTTRLEDFLTMRSGIEWKTDTTYESGEHSTNLLEASDAWVPFVLSQPMDTIPGVAYEYNDGVSVLLGEVVRQATGTRLDEWADEHLFTPIGIDDFHWKITPAGEVDSEGGLYLATEDLARIGYLFLRDGMWNGEQIISRKWVEESTQRIVSGPPNATGFSTGYGYQWWTPSWEEYPVHVIQGNGYGGQFLYVVPELDLVVVFNGWNLYGNAQKSTVAAFADVILAAIE